MRDLRGRERLLAVVLAATAGFVDAVGFLQLGGYFVSFMSGNSTRMVVGLAEGDYGGAAVAAVVLVSFFLGAVAGAVVTRRRNLDDRPAVLGLVAFLLLSALALHWITAATIVGVPVSMAVVAASMGAMNSVFHSGGEVSLGVTYMTGAVVKSAHRLVDALAGGSWAPYRQQVALWAALALGGVTGAVLQVILGVAALGVGAAVVIGALVATVWIRRREYRRV
ncbi:YoaK family protein [Dietzia cercidiphylli]|uniref:YoaK family protein n=1 Tax=Dietzia cercidiphylli TaxID=498199 RepID=UPI00223B3C20|nr:YoaK family protein [Dietzia cercidiphylli]MCT1517041.1 YoaK family protein [Dietzia cercidiphylli]